MPFVSFITLRRIPLRRIPCRMLYAVLSVECVQTGLVYAVEFSKRSGRDLINVAKERMNIVPIIEDARIPLRYRMLVGKSIHFDIFSA